MELRLTFDTYGSFILYFFSPQASYYQTKTAAEWRETALRTKGYAAGRMSDAEAGVIIRYLSETIGK